MYGCLLFRLFETLQSLFWSIFGLISLYVTNVEPRHEFTEFVGTTMFGTYNVISLVVLLNMLIAMMNNSYQHIAVSVVAYLFYRFAALICLAVLCKRFWLIAVLFCFSGSCRYRVEICKNKIMDELFWRRRNFAVSIQYNTQSKVCLLSFFMDKEAVAEETSLKKAWHFWNFGGK